MYVFTSASINGKPEAEDHNPFQPFGKEGEGGGEEIVDPLTLFNYPVILRIP